MLAYIDAGTAAAIAAMATGGLAGAKLAVQSMFMRRGHAPEDSAENGSAASAAVDAPVDAEVG